jgi:hypothetical protein
MSKKLFISLAPLAVVAAFVVMPTMAQASPHYYVNGTKLASGKSKSVISWGTITLSLNVLPAGNSLTCHNAAGAVVNGTAEGVNGTGATEEFATYGCVQKKQCPAESNTVEVVPKQLPWKSSITEKVAGEFRNASTGVEVEIICKEGATTTLATTFVTNPAFEECEAQAPDIRSGTSALHPGFLEFGDAGTKYLEVQGSTCLAKGKTEGEVKELGYNEQELINVKNP